MKEIRRIAAVLIAGSMLLGIVSCDKLSTKKNKTDIDEDAVIEAAEDVVKNLKKADAKKLSKLCSDFDEDITDYIDEIDEDGISLIKDVVFEIDEDSVEIDDEEASIDVNYTYFVFDNTCDSDSEDCLKEETGDFTIEFEIEDDELMVSNADDFVIDFYENVLENSSNYSISSTDPVETSGNLLDVDWYSIGPFTVLADSNYINRDDALIYYIICADYPELDCASISVTITDDNDYVCYTETVQFNPNETIELKYYPEDFDVSEFSAETYYCDAEFDLYDYTDYDWVDINGDNANLLSEDKTGTLNGNVYTNEFFGFSVTFDEDLNYVDPETVDFLDDLNTVIPCVYANAEGEDYIAEHGTIDDDDAEGFFACIVVSVDSFYVDMSINDVVDFYPEGAEICTIEGTDIQYLLVPGDPENQCGIIMLKDDVLLMLFANGSTSNMQYFDSILASISAI